MRLVRFLLGLRALTSYARGLVSVALRHFEPVTLIWAYAATSNSRASSRTRRNSGGGARHMVRYVFGKGEPLPFAVSERRPACFRRPMTRAYTVDYSLARLFRWLSC